MQRATFEDLTAQEKTLLQEAQAAGDRYINKKGYRRVGAALLCNDGSIYQGVSIRRTNTSNSTCGERMALDKALFDKKYDYTLLATVGFFDNNNPDEHASISEPSPPCGACRQILSEAETYANTRKAIPMLLANSDLSIVIKTDSEELLPLAYKATVHKKK